MLSKELKTLAATFGNFKDTGLEMSADYARSIYGILTAAAEDAQELECAQIPNSLRLTAADLRDENVIPFPVAARRSPDAPRGGAA